MFRKHKNHLTPASCLHESFVISHNLRCRLNHATMLSYFRPTSPVGHLEQFVLTWWSSLQQNDVAVFNPLKTLISKESADFVLSRRVFAKGCSGGVHDFMNTGCSVQGGVHEAVFIRSAACHRGSSSLPDVERP